MSESGLYEHYEPAVEYFQDSSGEMHAKEYIVPQYDNTPIEFCKESQKWNARAIQLAEENMGFSEHVGHNVLTRFIMFLFGM